MLELVMVGAAVAIGGTRCVLEQHVSPRVVVLRRSTGDFSVAVLSVRGWALEDRKLATPTFAPTHARARLAAGLDVRKPKRKRRRG